MAYLNSVNVKTAFFLAQAIDLNPVCLSFYSIAVLCSMLLNLRLPVLQNHPGHVQWIMLKL